MARMLISEKAHKALVAEGMVRGERVGVVLEDLVMGGISPKARTILETIGQDAPLAEEALKPKRLSDDPANQDRIRELWVAGDMNKADIAREVGYPRQTVSLWIRTHLENEGSGAGEDGR